MKTIEGMIREEITRQSLFDDFVVTAVNKANGDIQVINVKDLAIAIRKQVVAQLETTLSQLGKIQ